MKQYSLWVILRTLVLTLSGLVVTSQVIAQSLPGDTVVHGPMFSPVYNNSVRVWVLTKNIGSGKTLTLEVKPVSNASATLLGQTFQSDNRLGYTLRTFLYTGLVNGETYTATVKSNGQNTNRIATIKNEAQIIDDFSFLSGGCGRIYDTSRCIDQPESQTHKNGDPAIFNRMANEKSDLMIWLGDATYLLGLQHAAGQCPGAIDDWANKDTAFARYLFYRQFHDKLLMSMPQLAITDNHDTGPNEFNKTMPTLNQMKDIFMQWWPNPEYKSTAEGQGLFSSYKYKDVEYFLLDNRSYRDDTTHHLGPDQFAWLKQSLINSTATFKILINGTPSFAQHWGGRNFSITDQGKELFTFIQDNNVDGVISLSADIHEQEFYGRYGDSKYPLFDVLSGNLNSDVGNGTFSVDYTNDRIMRGVKQTYLKISLSGEADNRRMKVQYVDLAGNPYFESIIHADMLTSLEQKATKLDLAFSGNLDDSAPHHFYSYGIMNYVTGYNGAANSAIEFNNGGVNIVGSSALSLQDRAFSIALWAKPTSLSSATSVLFSNASANAGFSIALAADGKIQFIDHGNNNTYTSQNKLTLNQWSHLVWKYDNIKRELSLYQNGLFVQRWNNVISTKESTSDVTLGRNYVGNYFSGSLDNLKVFGKLLSDNYIKELANFQSNRTNVINLGGSQAMAIPGSQLNPALSGDFTIEFWGRLIANPVTNGKILASNARVDGNTTGISFEFASSKRLNVVIGNNSSSWNTISEVGAPWNLGEWNHVAVTATRNGTLHYFVNGEKLGETSFGSYILNTTGLGLGDSPAYGSDVNAELDELRIWNRALSQAELQKNMHIPLAGAPANLVFYYDFNNATTNSITSKGSNTYAIPLSGANIVSGSAPVAEVPSPFNTLVAGNWSAKKSTAAGLYLSDVISNVNTNVVIGFAAGTGIAATSVGGNTHYLTSSWLVNPSTITSGSMVIDLTKAIANPSTITSVATSYSLLQANAMGSFTAIASGTANGNLIQFNNISLLQTGRYYLAWRDKSALDTYPVKISEDCDYGGTTVGLMPGEYTLSQLQALGIRNDEISSIRIQSGYNVQLYQHHDFTGNLLNLTSDSPCLTSQGFNNTTSSLKISAINAFSLTQEAENYSSSLGVQLEATSDAGGGQNVGWIDAGDWMNYSAIQIPSPGTYRIEYRVASANGGGRLSLDTNSGATLLGALDIPSTGGWQNWTTISHNIEFSAAGSYNLGVYAQAGGWNLNWWKLTKL